MSIQPEIIPSGTPLYKGEKIGRDIITRYNHDTNQPTFFALTKEEAEQYGQVSEFITEQDFKLVPLNYDTMTILYKDAPENIKHILTKNYGYHPEKNEIGIRDSVGTADRTLASYLCNNNYDGYTLRQANTDMGGIFHPEYAICNNQDKIRHVKSFPTRKTKSPPKIERSSKRRYTSSSPDKSSNFMNTFTSPSKTYSSPSTKKWGGKSRKKSRKNRKVK